VVNVALPAIIRNLGGGLSVQQWIVDAYLLTLGSLILIAGSLSDLFGRKRILKLGLIGFAAASILCALTPNSTLLILARGLQGIAGALLVPSSLALIISTFKGAEQGKAIGTWTAWTGISFIIGPLVGGFLVDAISWRTIFAINLVPIAITLWLMRSLGQAEKTKKHVQVDFIGAVLCTVGLCGSVYALIEQPHYGWSSPVIYIPFVGGLVLLACFVWLENRVTQPVLPLELFRIRNFSIGNLATIAIYGGLSVATFLIVITVQQLGHYSAFDAGLSLLPVTIIMFVLSPRFGKLAGKYGPRLFMTVGPVLAGLGFLLLLRVSASVTYVSQVLPGVLVFGLGLSMTVAPLTAAILGDIPREHAGIGSAVNNAVSRIAGLIAVATIGLIVGTRLTILGFHKSLLAMAFLLIVGGLISAIGIQNSSSKDVAAN
jgi:EmrB/QacA subfamily drug resistance transporter